MPHSHSVHHPQPHTTATIIKHNISHRPRRTTGVNDLHAQAEQEVFHLSQLHYLHSYKSQKSCTVSNPFKNCLDKSPKRRHILTSWPGTLDVYSLLTVVRPIILDVLNIFYGHKKVHLGIKGKFYTIIYPYLTYCNLVWTSTYKSNLQKLTILHNGAIRCVADISYGSHTSQFFLECKLIKIEQMNMAQIG